MLAALILTPALLTGITHVSIEGFAFVPDSVHVQPGDTVRWTNKDNATHTSTAIAPNAGVFNSGNLTQNQAFQFVFATAGNFNYRCNFHTNMLGKVTVGGATAIRQGLGSSPEAPGAAPEEGALRDLRGRAVDPGRITPAVKVPR